MILSKKYGVTVYSDGKRADGRYIDGTGLPCEGLIAGAIADLKQCTQPLALEALRKLDAIYATRRRVQRKKLPSHKAGLEWAAVKRAEQANGASSWNRLPKIVRDLLERALEIAVARGKQSDLIRAAELIFKMVIEHCEAEPVERQDLATVSDVVGRFITARDAMGLDEYTIRDYRSRLGRFADSFQMPIADLTGEQIAQWLDNLPVISSKGEATARMIGPRTHNNYRDALRELCDYARENGHLPADWDELATIKKVKTRGRKLIFTAEEMRLLLEGARDRLLPALVLGAFAGLRTEEILQLEWADIDWDHGVICLRGYQTKTEESRQAPLLENAAEWLKPWRAAAGPVCTYPNLSWQKSKLARKVGLKWRHNALRHSFGTYRVAVLRSRHQVSIEMGNSEREIRNSYERPRTHAEGLKWFAIRPQNVPNGVLNLKFG